LAGRWKKKKRAAPRWPEDSRTARTDPQRFVFFFFDPGATPIDPEKAEWWGSPGSWKSAAIAAVFQLREEPEKPRKVAGRAGRP